ncbi:MULTISPECIES: HNH endonuclease [Atlantibacter]|uniref:HNH endonuclease n=1 Tax=Atlantibacter TaxID=1903434 RepID=UPI0028A92299|nr:HNH endonuclease [Atlantibacter hermannii]
MPFDCISIPIERIKEILLIDESSRTGLRWKVTTGSRSAAGQEAGSLDNYGYYIVKVDGVKYRNHRIIWSMLNGDIPKGLTIDHIDRNRSNNAPSNLRVATHEMQAMNKAPFARKGRLGKSKGTLTFRATGRIDASVIVNNKAFYRSGRDESELKKWIEETKSREYLKLGII